jgi:hypothetical protein
MSWQGIAGIREELVVEIWAGKKQESVLVLAD